MEPIIIVNLAGSIIPVDGSPLLRKGAPEFLERHPHIIVTSYLPRAQARQTMAALGYERLPVYGVEDTMRFTKVNMVQFLHDPRHQGKDIPSIDNTLQSELRSGEERDYLAQEIDPNFYIRFNDYRLERKIRLETYSVVVISDDPNDMRYARERRIHNYIGLAVEIPPFAEEHDHFSFDEINIDSLSVKAGVTLHRLFDLGPFYLNK